MANKYIRHGETFCGDGTTSAVATSNGGVGAWNNINVFEGTAPTYGALVTGDIVFIRSKDNAGANISRTVGADIYLGSATPTSNATRITWVLDNGGVWSGIDGVLTYTVASGNWGIYTRKFNTYDARTQDALVFRVTNTGYAANLVYTYEGQILNNVWIDIGSVTFSGIGPGAMFCGGVNGHTTILVNPRISIGNKLSSDAVRLDTYISLQITSPRIEVLTATTSRSIFNLLDNGCIGTLSIYGGEITGNVSNLSIVSASPNTMGVTLQGLRYPVTMALNAPATVTNPIVYAMGADASGLGVVICRTGGFIDSRQDAYYPTLTAYYPTLTGHYPDSISNQWAWRLYPKTASLSNKLEVLFNKLWTAAAAAQTATCEMLISHSFTTMATATKGRVWLELFYVDSTTGSIKSVSSADFSSTTALDASTAAWSTTTYGSTLFDKVKITLTTPTAIKQDTMITGVLSWSVPSNSSIDFVFVDPELVLTT